MGNYYYLFVNWGQCCQGTNSTYEVRVGRAEKVTGPYLDRAGQPLADGGGSLFLASQRTLHRPRPHRHCAGRQTNGPTRFSYHYYDAESRTDVPGWRWDRLIGPDGWPVAVNDATG